MPPLLAPASLRARLLAGLVGGPAYGQPAPDWQPDPVLSPLLIQQMVTDADATLWFGGVGGVYRVRPDRAPTGAPPPPPRLLLTAVGTPAGETEAVHYMPSNAPASR